MFGMRVFYGHLIYDCGIFGVDFLDEVVLVTFFKNFETG